MTTITIPRETFDQMLEALEDCLFMSDGSVDVDVLAALSAAEKEGEPVAYLTEMTQGPMVWTVDDYKEACMYCDDDETPVPLYTHPTHKESLLVQQPVELVKQLVEALETCGAAHVSDGGKQWFDTSMVDAAFDAGRAWLRENE